MLNGRALPSENEQGVVHAFIEMRRRLRAMRTKTLIGLVLVCAPYWIVNSLGIIQEEWFTTIGRMLLLVAIVLFVLGVGTWEWIAYKLRQELRHMGFSNDDIRQMSAGAIDTDID